MSFGFNNCAFFWVLGSGLSRIIGGIHVQPDNFGGQILGNKVGLLAYQKVQAYYNSDKSDDKSKGRADTLTASHTAALLDPKNASAAELLAACNAITASCGTKELDLLMEADEVPPPSAAQLRVQRYGGVSFVYDDYGNVVPPPCFTCTGSPGSTGPTPPTPNNTVSVIASNFPPSPPPIGGR
jgi:hypothetical protein